MFQVCTKSKEKPGKCSVHHTQPPQLHHLLLLIPEIQWKSSDDFI